MKITRGLLSDFESARAEDLSRWPSEAGAWPEQLPAASPDRSLPWIMLLEISDRRIRSEADLKRATKLPILATLVI